MAGRAGPKYIHITGLSEDQIIPVLAERLARGEYRGRPCLVVAAGADRAASLAKSLSFFSSRNIYTVPEDTPYFFDYEAKSRDETNDRIRALIALRDDPLAVVCAAVSGAMKKTVGPDEFAASSFVLAAGEEQDQAQIPGRLTIIGYSREHMVEAIGQFSIRGDILDVWPVGEDLPLRVSFFGDEVEHIRAFDPATQRSMGRRDTAVHVYPASELPKSARASSDMAGYLPGGGLVVFDDADRITSAVELRENETREDFIVLLERGECAGGDMDGFAGLSDIPSLYKGREAIFFSPFAERPLSVAGRAVKADVRESFSAKRPAVINGHMPLLLTELRRYIKDGFDVVIVCSTDGRLENLSELLADEDIIGKVSLVRGELASGIEITSIKKVWLWDGDIFKTGRSGRRRRRFGEKGASISSFSDIGLGDYVVHESHGIGKYEGLDRLEIQGAEKDYLKIRYSGGDHLYVPVEQMSFIQKYIGGGESHPRVSKLSGSDWKRAKARVRADIARMAAELAALAAERKTVKGHAFSPDAEWQMEFEDRFPYEETEDQLRAIASIKADMESPQPMERLLCGDVGYGKTEVALRAVFKCVADGKQAAVLVPTTLLASQHYTTFAERFEDFPFTVEMLSRFRTAAEQKKILKDLAAGRVDVVIGTHRLLSKDVEYKDLGLLIIDEEHRFGVGHKEKIKTLRKNVDVLSLTATPIPRTLHMSLLGVRDMDLIEEPPEDRYPVQTYVMDESPEIIRETVRRELDRKGQVFAVVSRIASLDRVAREIGRVVPEARIAVGHGQMNETQLEDTMADFIAGDYDVLVSTTIIESGLDIPNANTVLVFEADRFGLSQLYQIRGRVGRSNRIAFAYLLHRAGKQLSEVAEKRLRTIREFTEFGSGFRIAMRDLEIRGAGNLLGPEQHGHMAAVGYELYCRMVDEAVRACAGGALGTGGVAGTGGALGADGAAGTGGSGSVSEPKLDIAIDAFIPESYIMDEADRLEIYHRISRISDADGADEISNEIEDRYGSMPSPVGALIRISLVRVLAGAAGMKAVSAGSMAELDAVIETLKPDVIE